jgi:hypothetical protein
MIGGAASTLMIGGFFRPSSPVASFLVSELLPDGDKEKQLMQRLENQRETKVPVSVCRPEAQITRVARMAESMLPGPRHQV